MHKFEEYIYNPNLLVVGFLNHTAQMWSDKLFLELKFYFLMKQVLHLKRPKTFCEKLQWLKLYNKRDEFIKMVDKQSRIR